MALFFRMFLLGLSSSSLFDLFLGILQNRSYPLHSLSSEAHFDLLKPSERSYSRTKSYAPNGSSNKKKLEATEHVSSGITDLWPLFVRMTSFFFVKSRYLVKHSSFQYQVLSYFLSAIFFFYLV